MSKERVHKRGLKVKIVEHFFQILYKIFLSAIDWTISFAKLITIHKRIFGLRITYNYLPR